MQHLDQLQQITAMVVARGELFILRCTVFIFLLDGLDLIDLLSIHIIHNLTLMIQFNFYYLRTHAYPTNGVGPSENAQIILGTPPTSNAISPTSIHHAQLYATSPTSIHHAQIYPIGYQPPPVMQNLTNAISHMNIGAPSGNRRESFTTGSNYPTGVSQQYFVMTPPNGLFELNLATDGSL